MGEGFHVGVKLLESGRGMGVVHEDGEILPRFDGLHPSRHGGEGFEAAQDFIRAHPREEAQAAAARAL